MDGLVIRQAPRVDVAALDLLEVERRMASLIGVSDKGCTALPDAASAAATYHLQTGGQRIRARLALHASTSLGLARDDAWYQLFDDLLDVDAERLTESCFR